MSRHRRLIPSMLAATTAAALMLGGCASGSGPTAAPSATPTASPGPAAVATSSAPTAAATGTAAGASAGDATDPVTTSAAAGGSKVPAEPAACASIAQTYGAVVSAMLPVLQGKTGPTPFDAEGLGRATKGTTMGTIPAELAPDFATFTAAAEQLRGKDLTAAAELLNGPEVSKATSHIDTFLSDHC